MWQCNKLPCLCLSRSFSFLFSWSFSVFLCIYLPVALARWPVMLPLFSPPWWRSVCLVSADSKHAQSSSKDSSASIATSCVRDAAVNQSAAIPLAAVREASWDWMEAQHKQTWAAFFNLFFQTADLLLLSEIMKYTMPLLVLENTFCLMNKEVCSDDEAAENTSN